MYFGKIPYFLPFFRNCVTILENYMGNLILRVESENCGRIQPKNQDVESRGCSPALVERKVYGFRKSQFFELLIDFWNLFIFCLKYPAKSEIDFN